LFVQAMPSDVLHIVYVYDPYPFLLPQSLLHNALVSRSLSPLLSLQLLYLTMPSCISLEILCDNVSAMHSRCPLHSFHISYSDYSARSRGVAWTMVADGQISGFLR